MPNTDIYSPSIPLVEPRNTSTQAGPSEQAPADRVAAVLCWLVGLGYLCRALKIVAARLDVSAIWDDGLMFVRYAYNILQYGTASWNPHGPATYGLTSLLYMAVVLPMTALLRHNAAVAIECSSLLCGALFVFLFTALVLRSSNAQGRARVVIALVVLLPVVVHFRSLSTHFLSGMDTMFALAYLCAYFLVFHGYERAPSRARAVVLTVLGGLAFSARPDLLIYTMALPAALFLLAPARRQAAAGILVASGGLILAQIAVCAAYFHSPLPLPFYVKGFHHYGGFPYQQYKVIAAQQLEQYLHETWPLFVIIAAGLCRRFRDWSPLNKGLLFATLAGLVYFRYFTVQIMYLDCRFFYPTLPALGALAAYSLGLLWREAAPRLDDRRRRLRGALVAAGAALALVLLPGILLAPVATRILVGKLRAPSFQVLALYRSQYEPLWFALDSLSRFPDGITIATTDVGIPAILNPGKAIIDMAGLHDTHFAHAPFRAQWLFEHDHPDFLYLPFPDYRQYNQDIAGNAYFRTHYELYPAAELHTMTGVALWKDSPYYPQLHEMMHRQPPPRAYIPKVDTPITLSLVLDRLRAHVR